MPGRESVTHACLEKDEEIIPDAGRQHFLIG
jgi:hypothetical protein